MTDETPTLGAPIRCPQCNAWTGKMRGRAENCPTCITQSYRTRTRRGGW